MSKPQPTDEELLSIAERTLGPHTADALREEGELEKVRASCSDGRSPSDAVLAFAFERGATNLDIAGEFFTSFRGDLMNVATGAVRQNALSGFEGEDLIQSIYGDAWKSRKKTSFRTRHEFLAYLSNRVRWKAQDKKRGEESLKRKGLALSLSDSEDLPASESSKLSELASDDDLHRITANILLLEGKDADVLRRHLKGEAIKDIAADMGITGDHATRLLGKARERIRRR